MGVTEPWVAGASRVGALTSTRKAGVLTAVHSGIEAVDRRVSLPTTCGTGSFMTVFLEVRWTGNNKSLLVSLWKRESSWSSGQKSNLNRKMENHSLSVSKCKPVCNPRTP